MSDGITLRRPVEDDHRRLIGRVDDWWAGQKVQPLFPRLWFRHFSGTSWVAEAGEGQLLGFLVGFISHDHPDEAVIHLAATSPNHRRKGLGRLLYERFFEDVRSRGVHRVTVITWPGNPVAVGFHRAMGFVPSDVAGTHNLYGTPAFADYDADGADRVVFSRGL